jgi:hypothetical protein
MSMGALRVVVVPAVLLAAACSSQPDGDRQDAMEEQENPVDADAPGEEGAVDPVEEFEATDGDAPPEALSWSSPENISGTAALSDIRYQWGRNIAVGEDGTVHVVWREVSGEQDTLDVARIVYRRSDGSGWADVQDISEVVPGNGHPKITLSGARVLVVWHLHDPAADDSILLSSSTAGGAPGTFSAPRAVVTDATVSAANPLGEYSTTPSITADGSFVHIVWSDERFVASCGSGVPEVHLLSSPDLGESWSAVQRVSSADCRSSWTPAAAAWGGIVHVAWTDERHDATDCGLLGGMCREEEYYRRLADNGSTPDPAEIRLTRDEPGSEAESWGPSIAAWDGNVQMVWYDKAGGNDFEVYHLRSLDGGFSWEDTPRKLSTHAPGCRSACATIAACGPDVHAVWFEICGDTSSTILHAWSHDLGASWSDVSDVTSGAGVLAVHPHVACHDGGVHVVWNENSNGEIYYAHSE